MSYQLNPLLEMVSAKKYLHALNNRNKGLDNARDMYKKIIKKRLIGPDGKLHTYLFTPVVTKQNSVIYKMKQMTPKMYSEFYHNLQKGPGAINEDRISRSSELRNLATRAKLDLIDRDMEIERLSNLVKK